ncbi:hypothetical protein ACP3BQ_005259 [Klebsiella pneumoniae]
MNQLSKSWLQAQIAQLESDGRREDAYRPDENGHMTLAAFRAALASLDSEPVYQCQFAYKNHSGETEWVWEDVSQEFYEQFNSGGRLGEKRVLYTGPLSAPCMAELQAQGLDKFADFCATANNGHEINPDVEEIRMFAQQLRGEKY